LKASGGKLYSVSKDFVMKEYRMEVKLPAFLFSTLDPDDRPDSRYSHVIPRERNFSHYAEGMLGSRCDLDVMAKRKIPFPSGNRTLDVQT
jgi:hypothetical protein